MSEGGSDRGRKDRSDFVTLTEAVVELCQSAGRAIVSVYNSAQPIDTEQKADGSPVTQADRLAHQIIVEGLSRLTPDWPVLSEEQLPPPFAQRSQWCRYWLIDPLDGTKEFITRTGQFTVNIALIDNGIPVLGVVYLPLDRVAYIGVEAVGAWRQDSGAERAPIRVNQLRSMDKVRVMTSRRHKSPELDACIEHLASRFQAVEWIKVGSALKFCYLAEGKADIYPRFSPCSEWDTAAGQIVLEAAGGQLLDAHFQRLRYNQRESLINPYFYGLAAANFNWQSVLELRPAG